MGRWVRAGGVVGVAWAVATATLAGVGPTARSFVSAVPGQLSQRYGMDFESALVGLFATVLLLAICWLSLVTSLVALAAACSARRSPRRVPGCPRALRSAVLALVGVSGLSAPLAPALAASGDPGQTPPSVAVVDVSGLPLPGRAVGSEVAATGSSSRHTVVVQPGDSLWSIAGRSLPADSSAADICRGWHRIYAVNRARVGTDPNLLLAGTRLVVPALGGHPGKEGR